MYQLVSERACQWAFHRRIHQWTFHQRVHQWASHRRAHQWTELKLWKCLYKSREILYEFLVFKIIKLSSNTSTNLMISIYWIFLASSRFLYSQTFQKFNFSLVLLKYSIENQNCSILKTLKMFVTEARTSISSIIDSNVVTHIEMKVEKSNVYHENRQNLKNWFMQLEIYFSFHSISKTRKIFFVSIYLRERV